MSETIKIHTMFGSCLPPVVCWRVHVLFMLFICLHIFLTKCDFFLFFFTKEKHNTIQNKQTNVLLSIKTPTMSSMINTNHSIQLIHIIIFSLDRTIQKKRKKKRKKSHLVRNCFVLCCVFLLFVFVLCLCCQFPWIVHFFCPFGIL
jgi:Flp pilus assembly protein TadB